MKVGDVDFRKTHTDRILFVLQLGVCVRLESVRVFSLLGESFLLPPCCHNFLFTRQPNVAFTYFFLQSPNRLLSNIKFRVKPFKVIHGAIYPKSNASYILHLYRFLYRTLKICMTLSV